uniref:Uncharacterized protein n=1 Tax=Arundo donax TaxID=35708 RepID=A0A0A8YRP3_ARUDO
MFTYFQTSIDSMERILNN